MRPRPRLDILIINPRPRSFVQVGFQNYHEAGVGEIGGGAGGGKRQGKWVRSQAGGRGETVTRKTRKTLQTNKNRTWIFCWPVPNQRDRCDHSINWTLWSESHKIWSIISVLRAVGWMLDASSSPLHSSHSYFAELGPGQPPASSGPWLRTTTTIPRF